MNLYWELFIIQAVLTNVTSCQANIASSILPQNCFSFFYIGHTCAIVGGMSLSAVASENTLG